MPVPLVQAEHDVDVVNRGELTEVIRRRSRNGFGDFVRFLLHVHERHGFSHHHEIGLLSCGLGHEQCKLLTILAW
jgi:hypothetical protein